MIFGEREVRGDPIGGVLALLSIGIRTSAAHTEPKQIHDPSHRAEETPKASAMRGLTSVFKIPARPEKLPPIPSASAVDH
jgi:hypothetical protein